MSFLTLQKLNTTQVSTPSIFTIMKIFYTIINSDAQDI